MIKNALADAGNERSLDSSGLDSKLVAALEAARAVYRAVWWQGHDRSNRSRIDQLLPLVARHEDRLKVRLSDIYRTEWPGPRIRTDVVFHANWAGAYTTLYPTQDHDFEPGLEPAATGESGNPVSRGFPCTDRQGPRINQRASSLAWEAASPEVPMARRPLLFDGGCCSERIPGYTPYALKHGLWERAWPAHLDVLEREWKPYLQGNRRFEAAIEALVDGLAVPP